MFEIDARSALEIVVRVAVIYTGCMLLLRISGRREMSQMSPMDLLAMLLVSETVSPALTGTEDSVTGGLIAAATLFALVVGTGYLAFQSRRAERVLQGRAIVLIEHGRVRVDAMRELRISDDDLRTALHQQGLLHVRDVARAYVEPDGKITMINEDQYESSRARLHGEAASR